MSICFEHDKFMRGVSVTLRTARNPRDELRNFNGASGVVYSVNMELGKAMFSVMIQLSSGIGSHIVSGLEESEMQAFDTNTMYGEELIDDFENRKRATNAGQAWPKFIRGMSVRIGANNRLGYAGYEAIIIGSNLTLHGNGRHDIYSVLIPATEVTQACVVSGFYEHELKNLCGNIYKGRDLIIQHKVESYGADVPEIDELKCMKPRRGQRIRFNNKSFEDYNLEGEHAIINNVYVEDNETRLGLVRLDEDGRGTVEISGVPADHVTTISMNVEVGHYILEDHQLRYAIDHNMLEGEKPKFMKCHMVCIKEDVEFSGRSYKGRRAIILNSHAGALGGSRRDLYKLLILNEDGETGDRYAAWFNEDELNLIDSHLYDNHKIVMDFARNNPDASVHKRLPKRKEERNKEIREETVEDFRNDCMDEEDLGLFAGGEIVKEQLFDGGKATKFQGMHLQLKRRNIKHTAIRKLQSKGEGDDRTKIVVELCYNDLIDLAARAAKGDRLQAALDDTVDHLDDGLSNMKTRLTKIRRSLDTIGATLHRKA